MKPIISAIICTHNPRPHYISRVLEGFKSQTLPIDQWELLLIDNASHTQLSSEIDLTWHPNARHVREEKIGLTNARLRGFKEAVADLFVFADDDNILDPNYLKNVAEIFQDHSEIGAIGGKSIPEFEVNPEPWVEQFYKTLALRDLGDEVITSSQAGSKFPKEYPSFAPIGAGLALRRVAAEKYQHSVLGNSAKLGLGRTGKQLVSGEDNDIILTIMEAGWEVGYFPQLQLTHLIPASRITKKYLAGVNYASWRSWIQVLDLHGIQTWKKIPRWTVLPRKVKSFFTYQPWKDTASYIRWKGACGMFEGLGKLTN